MAAPTAPRHVFMAKVDSRWVVHRVSEKGRSDRRARCRLDVVNRRG